MTKKESIKNKRIKRRKKRELAAHMTKGAVAAAVLSLTAAGGSIEAATITVNLPSCSLTDAINSANTDSAVGGCSAGSGGDTIVLPAGSTTTLTAVDNDTYEDTGLPVISSEVTIQGNGSLIERSAAAGTPPFTIFSVSNTGNLTLEDVTVRNGLYGGSSPGLEVKNKLALKKLDTSGHRNDQPVNHKELKANITKNAKELGFSWGGGVQNYGQLTLSNSTISGNYGFFGGGISNYGTLTVTNSTISGNLSYYGGGINNYGQLTVTNSTISENVGIVGGGICNYGMLDIGDSTITGNLSFIGAGVLNRNQLSINRSTLSDNTAYYYGGGLEDRGTSTLTNSTFSGNYSYGYGGAFETWDGATNVLNCTVTANSANFGGGISCYGGVVNLANTIVSGNLNDNCFVYATLNDNGHNWFGDTTCSGTAQGDPLLGPLADNGGPTQTHALEQGSGAIDGAGACGLTVDQRGSQRPEDGDGNGTAACDIGAYERRAPRQEIASVPAPAMSLGGIAAFISGLFGVSIWGRRRKDI